MRQVHNKHHSTKIAITIITPVFNQERYVERCLLSVIDQKCPEVEHLIIDGASTDKTIEIVNRYVNKYPHIRLFSEKDDGLSDALNKGIQLAKGSILSILNSDDFYEPNTLIKVLNIFKNETYPTLVFGNCNVLNENGDLEYVNKPNTYNYFNILLGEPFPVNPSAYFYHSKIHNVVGDYDREEFYAMDLDFLVKVARIAKIKYVDDTFGNFVIRSNSITGKAAAEGMLQNNNACVFARHIKNMNFMERLYFSILKRSPSFRYFIKRISHYKDNPKDLGRFLKKLCLMNKTRLLVF